MCQKLKQQRTKVRMFSHCFPDLENLEEQDDLTDIVREEASAFRIAVMTGCHDASASSHADVNVLMPQHNK